MSVRALVRLAVAALSLGVVLGAPLDSADAGRYRPDPVLERDANPVPSTPEPAAAIVFGIGVGLVAWKVRRSRRSS
jgi:hypothetical protein